MRVLKVRRLEQGDLATRVAWLNAPSVYSQMTVDVPLSLSDTQQWFARNALSDRRRDLAFIHEEGVGGEGLVAMGGLVDLDPRHRHAELYIVVRPGCTGRGIGSQAVRWLCAYGFIQLGLIRIYLYTLAHNTGARRLYERLGFVHEGVLRSHICHQGEFVDRHVQALLKTDWLRQPWCAPTVQYELALEGDPGHGDPS